MKEFANSKTKVADDLRDSLRENIDKLAKETEIAYHPNSNDVVRDLVHPALYSYIKGVSKLREVPDVESPTLKRSKGDPEKDFWGRPYEDSKFQWLPSPFYVSKDGKCSIRNTSITLTKKSFPSYTEILSNYLKYFCLF